MLMTGLVISLHLALAAPGLQSATLGSEIQASDTQQIHSIATVASFDCAKATSAREKAVCSDPILGALDQDLSRLYRERRARLSPPGAQRLQQSQSNWLRFLDTVCATDGPTNKPWLSQKTCLTRRYRERVQQLQSVAVKIGPYLFNRIDLFAAKPSGDQTGSVTGFSVQHTGYPQIDNANTSEQQAWNKAIIRGLKNDGDFWSPSDYDLDYVIGSANAQFISLRWNNWTYCHGTPHGFGGNTAINTVLLSGPRPLTPEDVFDSQLNWNSGLKARFWRALIASGWKPPASPSRIRSQLEAEFVLPTRWLFTNKGLQIAFSAYEAGCYACTPRPITVPWSDLKPLLSKTSIALSQTPP